MMMTAPTDVLSRVVYSAWKAAFGRFSVILTLLFSAAFLGSCAEQKDAAAAKKTADKLIPRTGQIDWGLYQILWQQQQFTQQLDRELSLLGGQPRYVLFFRDLAERRGYPTDIINQAKKRGLTAIISLELSIWGREQHNYLADIAAGHYDDWFHSWGTAAAAHGAPVLFRFGFEMNGDWFSWGRQPELFQRAWRRAHAQMQAGGGAHVQWVFAPNVLYGELEPESGLHAYYPGDDVVDWVALDGYNFGDNHSEWHSWQSYDAVFSDSITALSRYQKPLMLSEIGSVEDARKAAWITDALARMQADNRIHAFVWFHFDKRREGEHNWRLDSDPASLKVFQTWAAAQQQAAAAQ